jgi:hypothetical protein
MAIITHEQEYNMFSCHDQHEDRDNPIRVTARVLTATHEGRTVRIWAPVKHGMMERGHHGSDFADQLRAYFGLPTLPRARMY